MCTSPRVPTRNPVRHNVSRSRRSSARAASARPISTLPVPSTSAAASVATPAAHQAVLRSSGRDLGRGREQRHQRHRELRADQPGDRAGEHADQHGRQLGGDRHPADRAARQAAHPQRREVAGAQPPAADRADQQHQQRDQERDHADQAGELQAPGGRRLVVPAAGRRPAGGAGDRDAALVEGVGDVVVQRRVVVGEPHLHLRGRRDQAAALQRSRGSATLVSGPEAGTRSSVPTCSASWYSPSRAVSGNRSGVPPGGMPPATRAGTSVRQPLVLERSAARCRRPLVVIVSSSGASDDAVERAGAAVVGRRPLAGGAERHRPLRTARRSGCAASRCR